MDDAVQVNDLNCIDEQSLYSGVYDVFGEPRHNSSYFSLLNYLESNVLIKTKKKNI